MRKKDHAYILSKQIFKILLSILPQILIKLPCYVFQKTSENFSPKFNKRNQAFYTVQVTVLS